MVLVRNQKQFAGAQQKRARFAGRRRAGQANGQLNDDANNFIDNANELQATQTENLPEVYLPQGSDILEDTLPINVAEKDMTAQINMGITPEGEREFVIVDKASQATASISLPPVPVQPVVEEVCEFPVQSLVLERQVNITNSLPTLANANVDRCGNLINYTERMTRTISAGAWVPVSGLQGEAANLLVAQNGEIEMANNQYADFANSLNPNAVIQGLTQQGTVVTQDKNVRVGRRKAGVRKLQASNQNAAYGLAAMRKFRSA